MIRLLPSRSRRGPRLIVCAAIALTFASAPALGIDGISFDTPGASEVLRDRLRSASLLLQAQRDGINDPQELFAAANAEYGRLLSQLYAEGHYSGVVRVRIDGREMSEISPLELPSSIREIAVTVDPGPPFTFARAEAAPLAAETRLPDAFVAGGAARSVVIQDAAAAVVGGWRAAGHAKAAASDSTIIADHRAATLDARLQFAPGPLVRFGSLIVTGNERMRPDRIREIAGFPTGEVFDPEATETAARRLRRTGTFASVALSEAENLGPGNTMDVTATLIEAPLRRVGFGAEFDTVEGGRLSAFWMHRNLLGGAERLRIEGEVSRIGARTGGRDYRFSARFSRPATFTPETTLTFGARAETVDSADYDAILAGFDVGVTHFFSDNLTGEAGLAYLYERAEDSAGRTTRSTIALPAKLTWDRRDDTLDTTSGTFLEGAATPFVGLSGTDSGAQLRVDARAYYGMGSEGALVLAGRVKAGTVLGADIARTPREYLFYSGGGGTVRGHPFRSLGVSVGGVSSGGRSFAVISGEVRGRVTDTIGVVGFADAGHVSAGTLGSSGDWHAGAGLGLRYRTGIGPIRVDLAAPVRGRTGSGPQLYVGIGQAF